MPVYGRCDDRCSERNSAGFVSFAYLLRTFLCAKVVQAFTHSRRPAELPRRCRLAVTAFRLPGTTCVAHDHTPTPVVHMMLTVRASASADSVQPNPVYSPPVTRGSVEGVHLHPYGVELWRVTILGQHSLRSGITGAAPSKVEGRLNGPK
mgnify:CR=1 FL=1